MAWKDAEFREFNMNDGMQTHEMVIREWTAVWFIIILCVSSKVSENVG